jgi:1,4-alpha-glucan branching enzyme
VTPRNPALSETERDALLVGRHADPHRVLGAHPATRSGRTGALVRAFHPEARSAACVLPDGERVSLKGTAKGLFEGFVPDRAVPFAYRLHFRFADGGEWERDDPYRFAPTLGELDLHLIGEGRHWRLWEALGANSHCVDGTDGVRFTVWAPNAAGVSVRGDFCGWDGRLFPMRSLGGSGVFELFVPDIAPGALYQFEIRAAGGALREKIDPLARQTEHPSAMAARVHVSRHHWDDDDWMRARAHREPQRDPLAIYEVHLGSFARVPEEGNRVLGYRELAPRLAAHARRFGFTHIELLPVMEHPFTPSWGYQVTGYYAPTARYGDPDDLRFLIDHCHQQGVGVILDWVPAHFPRDDWALRRFDGTPLYEHADPKRGEHPDWGTLIFDYGRVEVRNFLIANALYWLEEFHADGLRVDAVASMLYLDYSREPGEWTPNVSGGRENVEAVAFLRELTNLVAERHPGCVMIAEESTAWPGVTRPVSEGGLGFSFKWNLGWMHDTLRYLKRDPVHRGFHHDELSFAMLYEYDEFFVMPLSHDEVVHGKGSLLSKPAGDEAQRFAQLRLLLTYQWTRPGKQLVFMGTELAPPNEWNCDASLDWHLADDPRRRGLQQYLEDLGRVYRERACFWRWDHDPAGFAWIDCHNREHSVLSYQRRDGDAHALVILNLTPVPRSDYRIGAPAGGAYRELLSSDASRYGGTGQSTREQVDTEAIPWHGLPQSLRLSLPPLSALVLVPART